MYFGEAATVTSIHLNCKYYCLNIMHESHILRLVYVTHGTKFYTVLL